MPNLLYETVCLACYMQFCFLSAIGLISLGQLVGTRFNIMSFHCQLLTRMPSLRLSRTYNGKICGKERMVILLTNRQSNLVARCRFGHEGDCMFL